MRIDCYGGRTGSPTFEKMEMRQPLETKNSGGCTYMRYGEGENVPVHRLRVGENGMVRHEWAWGAWSEAERLDYGPISETKEVEG